MNEPGGSSRTRGAQEKHRPEGAQEKHRPEGAQEKHRPEGAQEKHRRTREDPATATVPLEDSRPGPLVSIGAAAAACGVSERALRYYQEIGILTPSGRTPGGLRRYSQADLDRVARIRELQTLLGLNLDEVRDVLDNEDHLASLRAEYRSEATDAGRRRELIHEALAVRMALRETVTAKRDALQRFLDETDAQIDRVQKLLDDELTVS